jgi:hypothetical protein
VKTGGRLVKHARYYWLLLAESHLTRRLFASMVRRIDLLPLPGGWNHRRRKGITDEMVGGGKVSETSVKRGSGPSRSSLRRAKPAPCAVSGETEWPEPDWQLHWVRVISILWSVVRVENGNSV